MNSTNVALDAGEREAVDCLRTILTGHEGCPALMWLARCSAEPFRRLFQIVVDEYSGSFAHKAAQSLHPPAKTLDANTIVQFYERFLATNDDQRRGSRGVYYTPQSITSFIVRETHEALVRDFGLRLGLADLSFVRMLDPAAGTGAFLVEAIDFIYKVLTTTWLEDANDSAADRDAESIQHSIDERWNVFVANELLPRLHGWELMLPAATLAHLAVAVKLHATGFRFETNTPLQIECRDSLTHPSADTPTFTVILGNPPYSTLSTNDDRWITKLLHGDDDGVPTADYFQVDSQPLNERKVWLHDDYVKFFRLSQRLLETTESGILGFVTNHGYLNNVTFRGMRFQLMQAFPEIAIVDLHGNRKAHERAPDGRADESVFDIEQGVAIGLFSKRPNVATRVRHVDVWGTRESKEHAIEKLSIDDLTCDSFVPQPPHYVFDPRTTAMPSEYAAGRKLTDVFTVHTTAPVTARDSFAIAFSEQELLDRLADFADLSIPDTTIRDRYFGNTRSRRYQSGDTRSWKLAEARRRLAAESDLRALLRDCWYRPFDRRKIVWVDWMIDWPRSHVMAAFDHDSNTRKNVALVARRQMLNSQPCNFFWVVDDIAIDGLIRSDNRGSESLFPLWMNGTRGKANISEEALTSFSSPEQLVRYTYGLFHTTCYRDRYASWLRTDFPRVMLPRDEEYAIEVAEVGRQLIDLHLLRERTIEPLQWDGDGDFTIEAGFPKYADRNIYVNSRRWLADVGDDVWQYRVGGHHVCRKWLKDRRGRVLSDDERATYAMVPGILRRALELIGELDELPFEWGGEM